MSGMKKAFLKIQEPNKDGKAGAATDTIKFTFNPKELTLAGSAEWKGKTGKTPAMPEYTGTKAPTLSLEMFFDDSEDVDVWKNVKKLTDCLLPTKASVGKKKPMPPFVSFGWGNTTYLKLGVIKSASVKFTRFDVDGAPIRAVATVAIDSLFPPVPGQNPTSGTLELSTERMVASGDSLMSIAYEELGAPSAWREIAELNGIDDPFRVRAGRRIVVPAVDAIGREN